VAGGGVLSSLMSNPETYSTLAGLLGAAGKGAGAERAGQNAFQSDQDRLAANIFGAQQTASSRALEAEEAGKLNRAQLGISAPQARTQQSVLGSLIQNIQPVKVNVPDRVKGSLVSYSGGLNPGLLNDLARQSGAELQNQAHAALLDKSDVPAPTDFKSGLVTPPQPTPYQEPGGFESGASAGATAASIGGLLASLLAQRNKTQSPGTPSTAGA